MSPLSTTETRPTRVGRSLAVLASLLASLGTPSIGAQTLTSENAAGPAIVATTAPSWDTPPASEDGPAALEDGGHLAIVSGDDVGVLEWSEDEMWSEGLMDPPSQEAGALAAS